MHPCGPERTRLLRARPGPARQAYRTGSCRVLNTL